MFSLPIDPLRDSLLSALDQGPVVLSAPTGSGKSTQVPRWLPGKVLVIEPRRVACRSLAARVAELQGSPLGREVGYRVRGEREQGNDTRVLFVTPGIALRDRALLERANTVILDEFHERRLDVDLLFGLLAKGASQNSGVGPRLLVMSATVDGPRIASHLGGRSLVGEGRVHPVDILHAGVDGQLPSAQNLASRVVAAFESLKEPGDKDEPGDVLVFLPGRAEIHACMDALSNRSGLAVLPLHGGLSLAEQSKVFAKNRHRKVILSTNVAETSVTIDGVTAVIDSGLVRRTRYHQGRGLLTLTPIALDSAEQRAGRAGRTRPGVCVRLWSSGAILEARTPPEIHRESLTPMVLAAAAAGASLSELPLLDPPKEYALSAAVDELSALAAFDSDGGLSSLGRQLFSQPLDPGLARILIEARGKSAALRGQVIDLISVLALGRPLFSGFGTIEEEDDDLRASGCDAIAALRALREGQARRHGLSAFALKEARRTSSRLRRAEGLPAKAVADERIDRLALAQLLLAADPRLAHVARHHGRKLALSNGGTELSLGRETATHHRLQLCGPGTGKKASLLEAAVVLQSRALGKGKMAATLLATALMPLSLTDLARAGLGRDRVAAVKYRRRKLSATIETVFAKKVIDTREESPRGEMARRAAIELFLNARLLPKARKQAAAILAQRDLADRLARRGVKLGIIELEKENQPVPSLEEWAEARFSELGIESGEDLQLIEVEDLLPKALDPLYAEPLERDYPATFDLGDASYEVEYDLPRRQVLLRLVRGTRTAPPPRAYLPRFAGFRICIETRAGMHVIGGR